MSKKLFNAPDVKLAIVAVSRDCFPESLSVNRRKALVKAYTEKYGADDIYWRCALGKLRLGARKN